MGEIFLKADKKKHETQKLVIIKKVVERLNNGTAKNILFMRTWIVGLVPKQHRLELEKLALNYI